MRERFYAVRHKIRLRRIEFEKMMLVPYDLVKIGVLASTLTQLGPLISWLNIVIIHTIKLVLFTYKAS